MQVHLESLLTQLIFEHSLRMRLASGATETKTTRGSKNLQTSQTSSQTATLWTDPAEPESSTISNEEGGSQDVDKSFPRETPVEESDKRENIVGRVTNLMTTDLTRIGAAKELIVLCA